MKKILQLVVLSTVFFCGYLLAYEAYSFNTNNYSTSNSYTLTDDNYNASIDYSGDLNLISINLSIQVLDELAFAYCENLETVNLPNATDIGFSAFAGCTSLYKVSAPNVTEIGSFAFNGCTNLITITLENASALNNQTFAGCENLKSVYLPNVKSLGYLEFIGCSSLKTVNIQSAINITEYTFISADSLEKVYISYASLIDIYSYYINSECTKLVPFVYIEEINDNNQELVPDNDSNVEDNNDTDNNVGDNNTNGDVEFDKDATDSTTEIEPSPSFFNSFMNEYKFILIISGSILLLSLGGLIFFNIKKKV